MPKLSVLIPSRGERFLGETVRDVLAKARGDVEVVAVLDGYWPDAPLPSDGDPRLVILHTGAARGMRPAINAAARLARGTHLMKLDAHCMLAEGFDVTLLAECDDDWLVVPRRHPLEPISWTIQDNGKPPVDAHYLSYPFERPGDPACGLHGTVWRTRARERLDVPLDDEMSSQGSCWLMSRRHWDRIGEMDVSKYGNFIQEMQELGLKTWLGGGQMKVNKRTWYAHLHKGKTYGRGYFISRGEQTDGTVFARDYWMNDRWESRTRDLRWLVERFWPVPGWPTDAAGGLDWDAVARATREGTCASA